MLSPFSPSALASLPHTQRPARYPRIHNDYHSINPQVRIPNKTPTGPLKVEAKVWFANERTWIAWLNNAVLIATLALALFNASRDRIATNFAYAYALISLGVLVRPPPSCFCPYQPIITGVRLRPIPTSHHPHPHARSKALRYPALPPSFPSR